MILSRQDLKEYLKVDSRNYYLQQIKWWKRLKAHLFDTPISDQWKTWAYISTMHYWEYHTNTNGIVHKIGCIWYAHKLRKLSRITGFQIPPNTCGKGLTIWHWRPIIINPKTIIGKNCKLHPMTIIGHKVPQCGAPIIGDNVINSGG